MSHKATESLSLKETLKIKFDKEQLFAKTLFNRLNKLNNLAENISIVEIGCAQGIYGIYFRKAGLSYIGIEPYLNARETSLKLADMENTSLDVREGNAENVPLCDNSCEIVIASNVIEHVIDVEKSFNEAFRILKPGGIFWFSAASSVCPFQKEIDGYPFFGWYPNKIKLLIMNHVKISKPQLIGYTDTPAINWFTKGKAKKLLRLAGFGRVYDRWDLRLLSEGGLKYRIALSIIRSCFLTKLIADILCEGCAFAAVKEK